MTDTNPQNLLIEHEALLARVSDVLWDAELGNTLNGLNNAARDVDAAMERLHNFLSQPEPEGPTDKDIMRLMPQQMHEDLAAAARALAEQASTISPSATGIMRIMLNRHAVDLARAVLACWGK
jgi:hypothetical protein